MNKAIAFLFGSMMMCNIAHASTIDADMRGLWKLWGPDSMTSVANNDGVLISSSASVGVPKSDTTASGYVVYAAFEIVAHGGYFCPVQLTCDSKNSLVESQVFFTVLQPDGFSKSQCAWLCTDGYSGEKCAVAPGATPLMCDAKSFDKSTDDSRFTDVKVHTNGSSRIASDFPRAAVSDHHPGGAIFLGMITPAGKNGAKIAPVRVRCAKRKKKKTTFEAIKYDASMTKLACAEGYVPSANNDACMPKDANFCATVATMNTVQWCNYFPRDGYNSGEHYLASGNNTTVNSDGTSSESADRCLKYLCNNPGFAFESGASQRCVKCGDGSMRYGQSKNTGLCVSCPVGQLYSTDNDGCIPAQYYDKEEMQYGDNSYTKNIKNVKSQCWTKISDQYVDCVKHSK